MTAYAVFVNSVTQSASSASLSLGVSPGTYELRVAQIVFTYSAEGEELAGITGTLGYYSSGISGGTSQPIAPMRVGSPATTATAKSGATGSGTFSTMGVYMDGSFAGTSVVGSTIVENTVYFSSSNTYSPPFDLILASGTALDVTLTGSGGTGSDFWLDIVIYFEELRLSWHY